jgi:hypothetical protein
VPLKARRGQALFRRSDELVSTRRRFKFYKRSQLFIRTHDETLSIIAMCISNPLPVHLNAMNVFWNRGQAGSKNLFTR